MGSFKFWQRWLVILGALITFYMGIFFTFSGWLNIDYSYINVEFWSSQAVPPIAAEFQSWMYGVYGAMATAFGLFTVFMASIPFKRKEPWSWYCLASCFSAWFVLDTLISIGFRFYANAVGNLIFFSLMMLPLIFTRHYFFERHTQTIVQE